ncbi:hypothetical protein FGO68_gene17564 [Halteria grandinella]|uniref:Uncharacterized protein n=1 Tax=Halteria grandinella TaxID=5974 RepID=A0A8J8T456_HALGN|nr:hypothetical protein FGO68_gene17564 [Halteria grandinella]
MQTLLTQQAQATHFSEEEGRAKVDVSLQFIATLRNEVEAQRRLLNDRRQQNADLRVELQRTDDAGEAKKLDNSRLKIELAGQREQNDQLNLQKRRTIDDLTRERDRNAGDSNEIDRLAQTNEARNRECQELTQKIKIMEFDLQKALARSDDCGRLLDARTQDLKAKELTLLETEADLARLRAQQVSLERELEHQRSVDARLRGENGDLERRLDGENHRNADLGAQIAELDTQIRTREDYIYALRQDAEALRLQGGHLHETNLQTQAEIEALANHIRVLQRQNEDLSRELDVFVEANEAIRNRLDRRSRVEGLRHKNENELATSLRTLHEVRSPERGRRGATN